jgi:hypothetical protein
VLDTDHVSLFLAGNQKVRDRIFLGSNNVALTIVTVVFKSEFVGGDGTLDTFALPLG